MPPKKTKKKVAESLPEKAAEKPVEKELPKESPKVIKKKKVSKKKNKIKRKFDTDDIQKEIDDCEHIARNVNIDLDTPGITTITKTVVYDYLKKSVTKAEYVIGVK